MAVAEHKEHIVPVRVYLGVLGMLMLLLVVTCACAFIDVDRIARAHGLGTGWNTIIAITIAIVKALLIVLFFMHVRYSSKLTWAFAAAGFVWLGIMVSLTMTDYLTRNHPPGVNPKAEKRAFVVSGQ
jgi:cytochrome c oxidase subunit 4